MSRRNSLENKGRRREEREAHRARVEQRRNLPPLKVDMDELQSMISEANLAEQGFIVARNKDMLWKPGDED